MPKKTDLSVYSQEQLDMIAEELNERMSLLENLMVILIACLLNFVCLISKQLIPLSWQGMKTKQ